MDKHESQVPRRPSGCCGFLHLAEDNARFVLLAVVLVLYMLLGATLFQYLESEHEIRQTRHFWQEYTEFSTHYLQLVAGMSPLNVGNDKSEDNQADFLSRVIIKHTNDLMNGNNTLETVNKVNKTLIKLILNLKLSDPTLSLNNSFKFNSYSQNESLDLNNTDFLVFNNSHSFFEANLSELVNLSESTGHRNISSQEINANNEDDVLSSSMSWDESFFEQQAQALERLHRLLYAYGNATATGIIYKRRRWDFAGSFHFVGTIVSTIGYGSTAPQTTAGKAVVILYGLFGCSGGILFFNLFLERIITFLAYILRTIHLRRLKKRLKGATMSNRRVSRVSRVSLPDILDDEDAGLEHWKPSVYWVMLSLTISSTIIALCAAAVYSPLENWTYFEALYFCFVSFATIGFGDYVSTQETYYPHVYVYQIANFMFLVLGCCCIYSLLNVTSIVIKQFLNWIIMRLQCRCLEDPTSKAGRMWRRHSVMVQSSRRRRRRRSSMAVPAALKHARRSKIFTVLNKATIADGKPKENDTDSGNDLELDGDRRMSGELISMKDFLQANKVSLAVMQKQLYETAQMQRGEGVYSNNIYTTSYNRRVTPDRGFTPGSVGPLAIVSQKLGENKNSR